MFRGYVVFHAMLFVSLTALFFFAATLAAENSVANAAYSFFGAPARPSWLVPSLGFSSGSAAALKAEDPFESAQIGQRALPSVLPGAQSEGFKE